MNSGIINIYKEAGYTSHDVVAKLRGILHQKRIGHTGTLDPDAEGVLPVCLGRATKVCDLLTDRTKTYRCKLLLGQETDTQDTSGTVLATYPVSVDSQQIRDAAMSFVGIYQQVPPMYSALKVQGKKLYELARQGVEVERAPRQVEILELKICEMELPYVSLEVTCSKGTYIRTLCYDIGRKLGCGGTMAYLLRTRVGEFNLEDTVTLAEVEQAVQQQRHQELIRPVDSLFQDAPALTMEEDHQKLLENGNRIPVAEISFWDPAFEQGALRIYDHLGRFVGIYRYHPGQNDLKPDKIFWEKDGTP